MSFRVSFSSNLAVAALLVFLVSSLVGCKIEDSPEVKQAKSFIGKKLTDEEGCDYVVSSALYNNNGYLFRITQIGACPKTRGTK